MTKKLRRFLLPATVASLTLLLAPASAFAAGSFAGGVFVDATCDTLSYLQGGMGAMLTAAAVLVAIATAAFGDFKLVITAIVVAVCCYGMGDGVEFFFGDLGCGGAAAPKSAQVLSVNEAADAAVLRGETADTSSSGATWSQVPDED